jgi:uncharacterized membrane protein YjjB (DUF3815 family)
MTLGLSLAQSLVLPRFARVDEVAGPQLAFWAQILHQAFFGGIAAAGFGILFNAPPRILGLCFASGAFALAVRTTIQGYGASLPVASFAAALALATMDRTWQRTQSPQGSVLAVVGCIAMIPGGLAAKGLLGLFELIHATPESSVIPFVATLENMLIVTFTLVAIGIGLIIPTLVYPSRSEE